MEFYAHTVGDISNRSQWEPLETHLHRVAALAREFAAAFAAADWGELAGLWHDIGKYRAEFQERLSDRSIHAPHAGVGAALAGRCDDPAKYILAFAIAGHHAGLANPISSEERPTPLREVILENRAILDAVLKTAPAELTALGIPSLPNRFSDVPRLTQSDPGNWRSAFFVRMLFSALVDADRLATAEFYARAESKTFEAERLTYDSLPTLRDRLDAHIDAKVDHATRARPSPMNSLRMRVLEACRAASTKRTGLFSLTVPTGGGKTLSAMSFALRHCAVHGLRRVIVVIPFTSIIEQNAKAYRDALGTYGQPDDRNVLEHHSGVDEQKRSEEDSEAERRRQTAAENWDAPIVVTTTVQFFESLFSNNPSRCRKLHRIANSTIILDEVQTLPPQFLFAIIDALRELTTNYGCSIVLSTATPPALEQQPTLPKGLTGIEPIIPDFESLFSDPASRRVTVDWRTERVTPYADLALEMSDCRQVLAIVHRRADARNLYEQLPQEGRFHLSALMCPAHRLQRIHEIRATLEKGEVCRVVSTQLIEAGVDVDFPVVYRALAGLDSLAQSAGRCDREGRLTVELGRPGGCFIVFRAETEPPRGTLFRAMQATEFLLSMQADEPELSGGLDPFNPRHGALFFRQLYQHERLDAANVQRELYALNFANAAEAFRLIDDKFSRAIVVPWDDSLDRIEKFRANPSRQTSRALQPYIVQVRQDFAQHLADAGAIELWQDRIGFPTALFGRTRYSHEFGLDVDPNAPYEPEILMS